MVECMARRAAGIEVWLDQSELHGGDTRNSPIRKQIKTCALFLPVISANVNNRGEGYFRSTATGLGRCRGAIAIVARFDLCDQLHIIAAQRYVGPATIAAIHASLGEIDEAVHWYQKEFEDRIPAHQPNRSGSAPGPSSVAVCRPRPSDPAILRWGAPWYHAGSVA